MPGALATYKTNGKAACPECGSVYFKWSSYTFDIKKYRKDFDPREYVKLNKF